MLVPDIAGRDLRISSQTGSGKTVAIGLALRDSLDANEEQAVDNKAHPRAMVIVPTRELAKQVHEELAWLYASRKVRIASVTGGGGYRDELRAFRQQPAIVVGTPGRLLDHLNRGAIDASDVATFVLDEADRMLDMGFRDDIDAIFGFAPEDRRTILVSATFPREVKQLADRIQNDPAMVEGTPLGTANEDIEHLIHLVNQQERLNAIINLLLEDVDGQTLIFARTRADVAELTQLLQEAGFSIVMLSGEMEQAERNRALAAFKRGTADALVATDVAARGIDVNDVTRVIHAEPPTDADAYTHRSGRTGRAGKKGISSVLVAPRELHRTTALMQRAKVRFRFAPIPTADSLRDSRDGKLFDELTADFVEGDAVDARSLALAERLLQATEPARAVARLVAAAMARRAEARDVTPIVPPQERERRRHDAAPTRDGYIRFRVSWGTIYGADVRRLVAMLCRRGGIEGRDIGAINLGKTSTVVEIAGRAADAFERATAKPDPRDPKIQIRRWSDEPAREAAPEPRARREAAPEPAAERPSKRETAPESAPEVAADRPSKRAAVARESEPKLPAERPSRRATEAPPAPVPPASSKRAPKSVRELPSERPSERVVARESEPKLPAERPSRRATEAPPAPPPPASSKRAPKSARELPTERESEPDLPADRPSKRAAKIAPERESEPDLPADRPSKRAAKSAPERESEPDLFADRPSKRAAKSAPELPAEKPSKRDVAAKSAPELPVEKRDVAAAPPKAKKAKAKAKPEEKPFQPRDAVVRRERPVPPKGESFPPFKPWKKAADESRGDDRAPAPSHDARGDQRGYGPPRGRDDRGQRPRDDRGPQRPRDDRGPQRPDDRGPPRGGPPGGHERGPGPARGHDARPDQRGSDDRGGPARGDRGPSGDRRGPPPWERRGPNRGPSRGGNAPPKRGRPR